MTEGFSCASYALPSSSLLKVDRDHCSMCVSTKHKLIFIADSFRNEIVVFSLENGSVVRVIRGVEVEKPTSRLGIHKGGMSISADETFLLVAERWCNRVREINIFDGSLSRFLGIGVLCHPNYVDCNSKSVVVSEEYGRISVLSWPKGCLVSKFWCNQSETSPAFHPKNVQLIRAGNEVAVVSHIPRRLFVFTLSGALVEEMPLDEVTIATGIIQIDSPWRCEIQCFGDGLTTRSWRFKQHNRVAAALPYGGMVVLSGDSLVVFDRLRLRFCWIKGCVQLAAAIWTEVCTLDAPIKKHK